MKRKIIFLLIFVFMVVSFAIPAIGDNGTGEEAFYNIDNLPTVPTAPIGVLATDEKVQHREENLSIIPMVQLKNVSKEEDKFIEQELIDLIVDYHLALDAAHLSQSTDITNVTKFLDMESHTGVAVKESLLTNITIEKCGFLLDHLETQDEFSIDYTNWEIHQLGPEDYQVFVFQHEKNPNCYVRYNSFFGLNEYKIHKINGKWLIYFHDFDWESANAAYSPVDRPTKGNSDEIIVKTQIDYLTDLFNWSNSFSNLAFRYVFEGTVSNFESFYFAPESVNQRQKIYESIISSSPLEWGDARNFSNTVFYNGNRAASYALRYYSYPGNDVNFYTANNAGGDCTNFVSQCVSFGFGTNPDINASSSDRTAFPMEFGNDYVTGWYAGTGGGNYAWENVEGQWNYLVNRSSGTIGAHANWQYLIDLTLGSVVQISYDGGVSYGHSTIVCSTSSPMQPGDYSVPYHGNYLLAQHSTTSQGYTIRRLSYWMDSIYAKRFYLPYNFVG